ncbi:MAG: RrF2 family transcriptional regulator [Planctomycetota bacterium]|jgi:Rrf2 family protein
MLFTRKTDYALVALAGLARRNHGSLSARDLADELSLPLPVLRNILKLLTTHGLLVSSRGPSGGYQLARPPRDISLAQVIEVIEGPVQLVRCCTTTDDGEPRCSLVDSCLIKGNVRKVHESLIEFLNRVTLAELTPEAATGSNAEYALRIAAPTP